MLADLSPEGEVVAEEIRGLGGEAHFVTAIVTADGGTVIQ